MPVDGDGGGQEPVSAADRLPHQRADHDVWWGR